MKKGVVTVLAAVLLFGPGIRAFAAGDDRIVLLDPGHQGSWVDMSAQEPMAPGSSQTKAKATTGTQGVYSQVPEYQVNLQVALALRDILEERGYQVILTREDNDTAISNKERAELATSVGADISVRIHANGSEDRSVSGALSMAPSQENPYVGELALDSQRLAREVLDHYCEATGLDSQGILLSDTMTGINWSTVPVAILEMGYMSNEGDDLYITDESHHQTMAVGIADGIDAYFAEIALDNPENLSAADTGLPGKNLAGVAEYAPLPDTSLEPLETVLNEGWLDSLTATGEKWSVAVVDLTDGASCMIRPQEQLQAASVAKLFIMGAVYENLLYPESQSDAQEESAEEIRELLTAMITVSDNDAANALVERLGNGSFSRGAETVDSFCMEQGFFATHLGRRFLAENPADDNYTSALDCARFLEAIYRGELVSPEASQEMLELLKGQTRTWKIPAGLPDEVQTANKTGEMAPGLGLGTIENDTALVLDEERPYVICILSNEIADNSAAQQNMVQMSAAVWEFLSSLS